MGNMTKEEQRLFEEDSVVLGIPVLSRDSARLALHKLQAIGAPPEVLQIVEEELAGAVRSVEEDKECRSCTAKVSFTAEKVRAYSDVRLLFCAAEALRRRPESRGLYKVGQYGSWMVLPDKRAPCPDP